MSDTQQQITELTQSLSEVKETLNLLVSAQAHQTTGEMIFRNIIDACDVERSVFPSVPISHVVPNATVSGSTNAPATAASHAPISTSVLSAPGLAHPFGLPTALPSSNIHTVIGPSGVATHSMAIPFNAVPPGIPLAQSGVAAPTPPQYILIPTSSSTPGIHTAQISNSIHSIITPQSAALPPPPPSQALQLTNVPATASAVATATSNPVAPAHLPNVAMGPGVLTVDCAYSQISRCRQLIYMHILHSN